jgi:dephospho-CoA kinase
MCGPQREGTGDNDRRVLVVGLLGGIASGKTTVAEQFGRLGAEVIQADRIGHDVLRDAAVRDALRERWGDEVLDEHGRVDRRRVARIVFAPPPRGPRELAYLEQLTHPRIARRVRRRIASLSRRPDLRVIVLDAPVLHEAGWEAYCDKLVYVAATRRCRLRRARGRGWSEADFAAREAAQKSLHEKRKLADWVIDNSKSPEDTFRQVQQFWRSLGRVLSP